MSVIKKKKIHSCTVSHYAIFRMCMLHLLIESINLYKIQNHLIDSLLTSCAMIL